MKLPLYNKILRRYRELTWSNARILAEAATLSRQVYDVIDSEFGEEIIIHPNNGVVIVLGKYDTDRENVLALFRLDLLSHSVHIIANESGDYLGFGRSVKKLLDGLKFHVYYENKNIVVINGVVAYGSENIMNLQLRAGNLNQGQEKHNETIH